MQDRQDSNGSASAEPTAIVGIGCAGGGMDALENILQHLPTGTGAAFLIAQPINDEGAEVWAELISSRSNLAVTTLDPSPLHPRPNHVYLVPRRTVVQWDEAGIAAIPEQQSEHRVHVIDDLFFTMAQVVATPVVGVLLSGAGSDGTLGLAAIRDAGGLTVIQDSRTAKHTEMLQNAAPNADRILAPQQFAAELLAHLEHLAGAAAKRNQERLEARVEANLLQICDALLAATEYDFRHYKQSTLVRRIVRRMRVLRINDADQYLQLLQSERDEAHALFRELLVSVTAFFRDPDTFATLAEQVIPKLFDRHQPGETIRVWVPACATGQEAYTLAMLMIEERDKRGAVVPVQIFATDIDKRALNVAREGRYPGTIRDEVTERRLNRFFTRTDAHYTVCRELRDLCIFSVHNLISDPPFVDIDLISCRNLLIYMGQPLQLKLVPVFHAALRPDGYLLLGPSEDLSPHSKIFRPIDKQHRISQRRPGPIRTTGILPDGWSTASAMVHPVTSSPNEFDIHRISQRIVLDEFAPRYAVVDDQGHLVSTSAGLERYFEFPDGPFANHVVKIAKSGLRNGLRKSLLESRKTLRTVVHDGLTLKTDEGVQQIRLTVQPMPELGHDTGLFMLVFQERGLIIPRIDGDDPGHQEGDPNVNAAIEQLERQLDQARSELESTVRDLENSNVELKSSNEELRSLNEELQAANEELESSKEEIQTGMEALTRARNDLQFLLEGTRIATIFLDPDGNINSFTPTAGDIYHLRGTDIGRPLTEITHKAREMPPIPSADSLGPDDSYIEDEIQTSDSHWFLRRVLPYRNEGTRDSMILTFVDISQKKRDEIRLAAMHSLTEMLVDTESFDEVIPQTLDDMRQIMDADVCSLWLIDTSNQELICVGSSVSESTEAMKRFVDGSKALRFKSGVGLPGHIWQTGRLYWMEDVTDTVEAFEFQFVRRKLADQAGIVTAIGVPIFAGHRVRGVIEFFADTKNKKEASVIRMLQDLGREIGRAIRRKRLDDKFRDEEVRRDAILAAALDCIVTMDMDGRIVDFNAAAESTFGYSKADVSGKRLADVLIPPELRDAHRQGMARYLSTGEANVIGRRVELTAQRADGTRFPIELAINVSHTRDGTPFFTGYLRDITERKEWEAKILQSQQVAESASRSKSEFVANMSHEIRTPMTAVLGYVDLLLAQEDQPEKLDHLRTIQRNGNFLLEIINDILDLSKIEAGKLEITTERFSMVEFVSDVRSMMHVRAVENDLILQTKFDGPIPEQIESDPKRLRQILVNLIGNAIKFTNAGSVQLVIRAVHAEDTHIQFDVIDTGIGMTPEQQSRLFQAFSQGDASVTRSFGGTGLGLAISQRLVHMLGGEISAESERGTGSKFTFTVSAGDVSQEPLIQPQLDGSIESTVTVAVAETTQTPRLHCRVLVVDDRRDVRFLSGRLLSRAGAEVEEAVDGLEAIERFEADDRFASSIDLVLLDMQMPRLDGYQTATRLRQLGFNKPIIALTADAMQSDMNRCLDAGCNEFLSKPIDNAKLIETVARLTSDEPIRRSGYNV